MKPQTLNHEYPTMNIIGKYAGFGGITGGLLIYLVGVAFFMTHTLIGIVEKGIVNSFSTSGNVIYGFFEILSGFIITVSLVAIVGSVIGFLPALLTGLVLNRCRVYRTRAGLIKAFIFGYLITAATLATVVVLKMLIENELNMHIFNMTSFVSLFWAGVIGGSSALVLGRWVLPKPQQTK